MQEFEGGTLAVTSSGFMRLVDGRKRPWSIVGSLPIQKKPRLLVLLVSHFKDKLTSDSRKDCQEDWAYLQF